jgi:hypothetical protein
MSRRRGIILLSLTALVLVGAEVAVRRWEAPKACVQIINEGEGVMDDLVVDYAGSKVLAGRLGVGQATQVWLTAGPKGPLRLDFRQKGNALSGFQIPDFDPAQNLRDGFKLMLIVKTNEIQRFMDDDDSRKDRESLGDRIKRWIHSEIEPAQVGGSL